MIAAAIYLKDTEPYTVEDIKKLTGLTESSIKESKKLLKENNMVIYHREAIKDGDFIYCVGSSADVNGINFKYF